MVEGDVHTNGQDQIVGFADPREHGVNPQVQLVEETGSEQRFGDWAEPMHQDRAIAC